MGKDVIIRGETYNGVGKVNLLTANGSANFYDVSGALCTITVEEEDGEESYISDKTAQQVYAALEVGINPVFRFHDLRDNADAYIYASLSKLESTANGEELSLSSFQTDPMTAATSSDYFELIIAPPVEKTVSGSLITVTDALAGPVINVTVAITPAQSGSGDPSPTNVRPISGFNVANIVVSPTTTAGDGTTYTVSFGAAGTVYGGTLDVTTGVLTIDHQMFLFDGSDTSNWTVNNNNYFQRRRPTGFSETTAAMWALKFYSNALKTTARSGSAGNIQFNSFYAGSTYLAVRIDSFNHDLTTFQSFLTNTGLQILVPITEQTVQLTPTEVQLLLGTNNVWSDTNGDVTLTYMGRGN